MLVQSDGRGFEGLDIELIDAAGKVIASGRSDYDGFFLFDRIPYGRYSLRLTADSAHAAGVGAAIDRAIEISAREIGRPAGRDPDIEDGRRSPCRAPAGGAVQNPR